MDVDKAYRCYVKLKRFLARTKTYDYVATIRNRSLGHMELNAETTARDFMRIARVRWEPNLPEGWTRLTFSEFLDAYQIELEGE